ncbi:MAG: ribosomal-protein-alanine N-acetyltransferase [Acidimicrobiia bacterium]|nr:ribosomal-protein-alanine N-acetyltransferase [Acidimicrobiia bacterium]MXZ06577.1 ribosomal-protein-alanine N-acetyltransferase [Acidimicrobiia bacterium]MYD03786.1 ribosomal-protein-alanine N-acetyltransferase [Acidimicrobiia bacterium]MYH54630.1 ribosomal-protein-alanine N-acetyltransferase [Acidimicrobiia bacterium]
MAEGRKRGVLSPQRGKTTIHAGTRRNPGVGPSSGGRPVGVKPEVVVRPMLAGDLDQVMEIEEATFLTPWPRRVFENELVAPGRSYWVADYQGRVVGFGGLMLVDKDAHINTLATIRPAPVPALGSRVMLRLVEEGLLGGAEHLSLEVRSSNWKAQEFYRKFGLAPVGIRKGFYQDEDALIMWAHDLRDTDYQERLRLIREALP